MIRFAGCRFSGYEEYNRNSTQAFQCSFSHDQLIVREHQALKNQYT